MNIFVVSREEATEYQQNIDLLNYAYDNNIISISLYSLCIITANLAIGFGHMPNPLYIPMECASRELLKEYQDLAKYANVGIYGERSKCYTKLDLSSSGLKKCINALIAIREATLEWHGLYRDATEVPVDIIIERMGGREKVNPNVKLEVHFEFYESKSNNQLWAVSKQDFNKYLISNDLSNNNLIIEGINSIAPWLKIKNNPYKLKINRS